jgi:hypothetical protein
MSGVNMQNSGISFVIFKIEEQCIALQHFHISILAKLIPLLENYYTTFRANVITFANFLNFDAGTTVSPHIRNLAELI